MSEHDPVLEEEDRLYEHAMEAAAEAEAQRQAELQAEVAEDWYDETEPWADPEIQKGYQAALGEFIVEFNRLDAELTEVLRLALGHVEKIGIFPNYRQRGFAAKVQALELLQTNAAIPNIRNAPIDEMQKIGAIRNFLAHAHFDQNPFDGTYLLIPPKTDKESSKTHLKEEAIKKWTARITKACSLLVHREAKHVFAAYFESMEETG